MKRFLEISTFILFIICVSSILIAAKTTADDIKAILFFVITGSLVGQIAIIAYLAEA